MKFIFLVRVISVILMAGSIGSVDLGKIDMWTGFIQELLGITLLILSNFWMREIKKSTLSRRKASVLVESMSYISTCILTQGEINGN